MTDFDKHSNEMDMNLLKAMKVLETLDNRTSKKCQAMDGREFSLEEASKIPATEYPNCRRIFVAVIRGFNNVNRQRAARSMSTGKMYRTDAKNFEEYAKEQKLLYSDKCKGENMNI
ncbi:hypothetical protein [Bacillus cereus]|uniref:hypothetical protein n=1 Tax=Bacillus cereus TaxID=1396 RepID=UPI000BFA6E25|nr:hypothetical protein [Bacillus cereus]PFB57728.1 hypothetical protein CN291_29865 [Bacillus cereus]PFR44381.1 hypothetical protein COK35_30520 [Bacillus cereus]PGW29701.1 hypothetical protein COD88_05430 [Bacillus cereus]